MSVVPLSLLLLEDDFVDQLAFKQLVSSGRLPCTYAIAGSVAQGRRLLQEQSFDVLVADHQLPDGNAFDVLDGLTVPPVVILATGVGDEETAVRALRAGLSDYLIKDPDRFYLRALPGRIEKAQRQLRVQQDLEESEARLRDLFEGTSDLIHSTAPDGRLLFVNRAWYVTLGYCVEEVKNLNIQQILHPDHRLTFHQTMERLVAGEHVGTLAFTVVAQDGRLVDLEGNISARFDNGQLVSTQGIFRDVTESKRNADRLRALTEDLEKLVAERTGALAESQARFKLMADTIEQVFWMRDVGTDRFVYASPAFEHMWQQPLQTLYEDPRIWREAIHPEDRDRVESTIRIAGQQKYDIEYRLVQPDGSVRWIHENGYCTQDGNGLQSHLLGTATDTTERKEMEELLLRNQRMESIGTLSGGVAHDLNNSLAPILMGLALLRSLYPEEVKLIDTMEASARRGASMVKQLLTFAKGIPGERALFQSCDLLAEMEKIVQHTFPKNIALHINCPEKPETILGDATQLHQVLLNLCVNARDAMPDGGTLTLSVQNLDMDAQLVAGHGGAEPGRYVQFRVADTGSGIPRSVLAHVFDPFFTTKAHGKGTGLGLSTAMGIVRQHKGFIEVDSEPDAGTTFSIYIPAAGTDAQATTPAASSAKMGRGNGELILVVDDEPGVRSMASIVLQAMNYKVLTANDGEHALALIASNPAGICLVITDLHMPNMDGLSFVKNLRHLQPSLQVVGCSGKLDQEQSEAFAALGVASILHKPFSQSELEDVLVRALGR